MFSTLLDAVDSHCPESQMKVTPEQHKALIDDALPWLSIEAELLLGATKALLGDGIFDTSEIGFEYSTVKLDENGAMDLPISFGNMYVRPERKNRALSLDLTILRSYTSRLGLHPASVEIELDIRNRNAKMIFESMYKDYRAQICRLLEQAQITFFTSYCSDIVGKAKSNKVAVKLDEYFSDPEVDNCFTLSKSCPRDTKHSAAIRAFLALSTLFVACRASLNGKAWRPALEKNLHRFA
ncbi:hypothetical protein D3C76_550640 [compost metagenome]